MADLRQVAAVFKQEQTENVYDFERHVAVCEALDDATKLPATYMLLPPKITRSADSWVWDDIVRMRVLNAEQSRRRQENHVCPLPLDIVSRTIDLYSNEGDLVLDPFGGLMSVPYEAVKMRRKGYGIELNTDYWTWGVRYMREIEQKRMTPTLFDLMTFVDAAQAVAGD
jgi:DNA modification methylase